MGHVRAIFREYCQLCLWGVVPGDYEYVCRFYPFTPIQKIVSGAILSEKDYIREIMFVSVANRSRFTRIFVVGTL